MIVENPPKIVIKSETRCRSSICLCVLSTFAFQHVEEYAAAITWNAIGNTIQRGLVSKKMPRQSHGTLLGTRSDAAWCRRRCRGSRMERYWEHDPTRPGVEEDAAAITWNAIGNTIQRGLVSKKMPRQSHGTLLGTRSDAAWCRRRCRGSHMERYWEHDPTRPGVEGDAAAVTWNAIGNTIRRGLVSKEMPRQSHGTLLGTRSDAAWCRRRCRGSRMEHYWEHDPTRPGAEEDAAAVTWNTIGNTIRRGLVSKKMPRQSHGTLLGTRSDAAWCRRRCRGSHMERYWEHDPTRPGVEEDAAAVTWNTIGNTIRRGLVSKKMPRQ